MLSGFFASWNLDIAVSNWNAMAATEIAELQNELAGQCKEMLSFAKFMKAMSSNGYQRQRKDWERYHRIKLTCPSEVGGAVTKVVTYANQRGQNTLQLGLTAHCGQSYMSLSAQSAIDT
jgi:hypothetical protein